MKFEKCSYPIPEVGEVGAEPTLKYKEEKNEM